MNGLQSTGVEFPEVVGLWGSTEKFRSVGAGVREKKFAFVPVKVLAWWHALQHHAALSLAPMSVSPHMRMLAHCLRLFP